MGIINKEKFINVAKKTVAVLANAISGWIWGVLKGFYAMALDKKVLNYIKKLKLTVLNWLGNSTDLNPIENLGSLIKLRLFSNNCTTEIKFIESIFRI